jgi:chemotaxis protein CheD
MRYSEPTQLRAAEKLRTVAIGELVVSADPQDVLVAYGLGSCVAICLYDPVARVGGMLHALLPSAPTRSEVACAPTRFVEQGVPPLLEAMQRVSVRGSRLIARVCGGACILSAPGFEQSLNIGERNIQAAADALRLVGLRIRSQDIGGRRGRTVKIYAATGRVAVKTLGQPERALE